MLKGISLFFSSTYTASHLPQILRAKHTRPIHTPRCVAGASPFPSTTPHIPWKASQPAQQSPLPTCQIPHPRSSSRQRIPSPELLQYAGSSQQLHRDGKLPPRGRGCSRAARSIDGAAQGAAGSSRSGGSPAAPQYPPRSGGRPTAVLPLPGRVRGIQGVAEEAHLPDCPFPAAEIRSACRP